MARPEVILSGFADEGPVSKRAEDQLTMMAALGLSSFFTTETALRKAFGDTVPKEWVDFAADQSDRTRQELMDGMIGEFGRVLDRVDLGELFSQLASGHVLEVDARIRLVPEPGREGAGLRVRLQREEGDAGTSEDDGPP